MKYYGYGMADCLNTPRTTLNMEGLMEAVEDLELETEFTEFVGKEKDIQRVIRWLNEYKSANGDGILALLADWIALKTDIEVEPDNYYCRIGLTFSTPWGFNDAERNLTKTGFDEIMNEYIGKMFHLETPLTGNIYTED